MRFQSLDPPIAFAAGLEVLDLLLGHALPDPPALHKERADDPLPGRRGQERPLELAGEHRLEGSLQRLHELRQRRLHAGSAIREQNAHEVCSKKVAERPGGYTRILKTGFRAGDNADMCFIELVDYNEVMLGAKGEQKAKTTRRRKAAPKKKVGSEPEAAAVEEAPVAEEKAPKKTRRASKKTAEAKTEEAAEAKEASAEEPEQTDEVK